MIYIAAASIILGILYFAYPRLENYYKLRPNLIIEIEPNMGITRSQTPLKISSKNTPGPTDIGDIWRVYKFEWNFDLTVRNNSEINAYSIKLLQHKNQQHIEFREKINFNKALRSQEEIILPFKVTTIKDVQGKDLDKVFKNRPESFDDLMILFEYKNPKDRKFYSRYYFNTDSVSFERMKESELQKYWH